ncbi:MAG: hypothetical protein HYY84_17395 [Deltaproteobacteria bacterium]|nr:hypothetical protein [Deltaproteobacteria bacterium]
MKVGMVRVIVGVTMASFYMSACMRVEFLKTDGGFVPKKTGKDPEYFVDRIPVKPYRSVGIIEVIAGGAHNIVDVVRAAAEKAQEIGCDLIVARAIHRVSGLDEMRVLAEFPGESVVPIQYQAPIVTHSPPSSRFEFICGIYSGDARKPGV